LDGARVIDQSMPRQCLWRSAEGALRAIVAPASLPPDDMKVEFLLHRDEKPRSYPNILALPPAGSMLSGTGFADLFRRADGRAAYA